MISGGCVLLALIFFVCIHVKNFEGVPTINFFCIPIKIFFEGVASINFFCLRIKIV